MAEKRKTHSTEAGKLLNALSAKKGAASKELQDRLAKRKKDQQSHNSSTTKQTGSASTETQAVHQSSRNTGETQAQKMEKYLSQLRDSHRLTMNRLKQFMEKEKRIALRHCEQNVNPHISLEC